MQTTKWIPSVDQSKFKASSHSQALLIWSDPSVFVLEERKNAWWCWFMYDNLLQKMVQVCRDLSGQANTVNLLHGQQSHTNANKGTNETGQKRFFGSSFVALEAVGGLPEHKGIIHGLFFFFFLVGARLWTSFCPPKCAMNTRWNERLLSSIVSSLMLLILQREGRLVLGLGPNLFLFLSSRGINKN